jgi:hypothetical protein
VRRSRTEEEAGKSKSDEWEDLLAIPAAKRRQTELKEV